MDDEINSDTKQNLNKSSANIEHLHDVMDSISAKQLMDIFAEGFNSFSFVVTTEDGTIVFANHVAINGFDGMTAETIKGKHLTELAPKEWALEQIGFMKKAVATMKPVPVVEMVAGTRLFSTLRPVEIEHNGHKQILIFMTVEPVSPVQLKWIKKQFAEGELMFSEQIGLGRLTVLTPRELEVLALMGKGLRQKEIAKKLCRSVSTVDRHRERIGEKLGIADRAELIMLAREAGLEVEDAHRKHILIKKTGRNAPPGIASNKTE